MSEWISVEERLPEMREIYGNSPLESERVIIFNGYFITVGKYAETFTKKIKRWEDSTGRTTNVTHWMPLPKAPGLIEREMAR